MSDAGEAGRPGEAEVHDDDVPVRAHHDVARLQVAVDDARAVGVRHGPADVGGDPARLVRGQALPAPGARHVGLERRSLHEVHREVVDARLSSHGVDRDDVRVAKAGCEPRLGEEPLDARRVALLVEDDLESHEPVEGELPREVDGAHAAPAQEPLDLVGAGEGPHERLRDVGPVGGTGQRGRRLRLLLRVRPGQRPAAGAAEPGAGTTDRAARVAERHGGEVTAGSARARATRGQP